MIHHVQLTCPPGTEETLREFYGWVLGLQELRLRMMRDRLVQPGPTVIPLPVRKIKIFNPISDEESGAPRGAGFRYWRGVARRGSAAGRRARVSWPARGWP
jgi:hypothetical protein